MLLTVSVLVVVASSFICFRVLKAQSIVHVFNCAFVYKTPSRVFGSREVAKSFVLPVLCPEFFHGLARARHRAQRLEDTPRLHKIPLECRFEENLAPTKNSYKAQINFPNGWPG